jgi:hypothetical protein
LKGTPWYGEISIVDFQVRLSINESATFAACALGHVTDHLGKKLVVEITQPETWKLIFSAAFRQFLGGKVIGRAGRLADATG